MIGGGMTGMTRRALAAAATALLLAAASGPALGQAVSDGELNLFISPCGQPFTAAQDKPYPIVDWFKGADANHDGKIDPAEMRADAEQFFKILDRNKDGFITGPEVVIYEHYLVPEILTVGAVQGGLIRVSMQYGSDSIDPGGGGSSDSGATPRQRLNTTQGAVQFSLFKEPEPVRAADRNFDYKVSLQEFRDQADRHFKALDVNGDGVLTLDELPQTMAERAAHARR
jgi:Ca2+-binding EF-hand superfamily protein